MSKLVSCTSSDICNAHISFFFFFLDPHFLHTACTVGQKTIPMFGYFAKIEVEQIKKIR